MKVCIVAEGIVMTKVTADEKKAVVVEVNAETDFELRAFRWCQIWLPYRRVP